MTPSPKPATEPASVRVKPLEWLSDRAPFFAQSPFCMYRIEPVDDDTGPHWQTTITYQGSTYMRRETEADAKAAAQADYEARIRSALASDASPSADAVAPAGWKLVPLEANREMLDAFFKTMILRRPLGECWASALAATPPAPAAPAEMVELALAWKAVCEDPGIETMARGDEAAKTWNRLCQILDPKVRALVEKAALSPPGEKGV